jgi:hypothetical protein
MTRSWGNALRAGVILAVASVVLLGASLAFGLPKWSVLDRNQFAFLPGTWFASQLATVQYPSRTCLLVGASVVREGFDSSKLKTEVPDVEFVNLATTGGWSPMEVIDIQSSILAEQSKHFRCIIVGLDNFYLRNFTPDAYELVTTNYISQLPATSLPSMVGLAQGVSNFKRVLARTIMPFGKHATDAQRWWRYGIYLAKKYFAPSTDVSNYELFDGELKPAVQFMYENLPAQLDTSRKQTGDAIVKFDLENPASYAGSGPQQAFVRSMARLKAIADAVVIVRMPLTATYARVEAAAEPSFNRAMKSAGVSRFIDCKMQSQKEEDVFFDTAHLNPVGRDMLSRSAGKAIDGLLGENRLELETSETCAVVEPS